MHLNDLKLFRFSSLTYLNAFRFGIIIILLALVITGTEYTNYSYNSSTESINEYELSSEHKLDYQRAFAQNDTMYNSAESSSNYTAYENTTYGIYLIYPDDWSLLTPINIDGERTTFIVSFVSPDGMAQLDVNRDIFDRNETIDTYLAETIQSYTGNSTDFTVISTDTIEATLAGNPGYELLYSETDKETGAMLLTKEVGTIVGDTNMVYFVSYYADIANYANYEFDANQIIDSLEIHIYGASATSVEDDNTTQLEILDTSEIGEI